MQNNSHYEKVFCKVLNKSPCVSSVSLNIWWLPSPQTSSLLVSPQNYSCPSVMVLAVPVAVRFLQRGNRELSRNMSSYLSLAAIAKADLLAEHTEAITHSVLGGRTHIHVFIHNKKKRYCNFVLSYPTKCCCWKRESDKLNMLFLWQANCSLSFVATVKKKRVTERALRERSAYEWTLKGFPNKALLHLFSRYWLTCGFGL